MTQLEIRDLDPVLGAEVSGFDPRAPLDDADRRTLRDAFDRRGVLVFRDIGLAHAEQVRLSNLLIGKEDPGKGAGGPELEDDFYVSNRRPGSAAPAGRLQFHGDTMWADQPFQVISLYGVDVEPPAVPTTFVSATHAWATLPPALRARVEGRSALHTAGEVRRGDLTDVLVSTVENPPSTVKPIGWTHPRTGETILYVCEQMTKAIVGLEPEESESLLGELFAHLYDPARRWNHDWRPNDLIVWDNLAVQHARPNVRSDGPARTLRKVASPIPQLSADQLPTYGVSP